MKKTATIISLVISGSFILFIPAFPQTYMPGYIVTLNGEKLNGYILDKPDRYLFEDISFKKDPTDNGAEEYNPETIQEFGFEYGREFTRFLFLDTNSASKDSVWLFAKKVVTGKVDLYVRYRKDRPETDMFLVNHHTKYKTAITKPDKSITTSETGTRYNFESRRYIGLLNLTLSDSGNMYTVPNDLRYKEHTIKNVILDYDRYSGEDYPVDEYEQRTFSTHDASVGFLSTLKNEKITFRLSFYVNKNYPEKSIKWSLIRGITYQYLLNNEGSDQFRAHMLSIIPYGINLYTGDGNVVPYFYLGAGVLFHLVSDPLYNNDVKQKAKFGVLPTINSGFGCKIKIGSKHLLVELTPTVVNTFGLFFNIGLSI